MSRHIQVLTLFCPDHPGLVAGVARILADHGGNILDAQQFNDTETQRFFMRVVFELIGAGGNAAEKNQECTREQFKAAFAPFASDNGMEWSVRGQGERRKVMLLVSKFDHCLGDLL